jgi:SAM-dependent methyltransferase
MKQIVHRAGRAYIDGVCKSEFESQKFTRWNERPIEFRFVFEQLTRLIGSAKTVLDVGTGTTALPHLMRNCGFLVTATDNVRDYWPSGMVNRHYHVIDDDITATRMRETFDVVTCVSVLEHIKDFRAAVSSMASLLAAGGHLILTCPFHESEYCGNVYDLPDSSYGKGMPYVCQSYSRRELDEWTASNGLEVVTQEYWRCFSGKLWTCGSPVAPPERTGPVEAHQLTCLLLRKRGA